MATITAQSLLDQYLANNSLTLPPLQYNSLLARLTKTFVAQPEGQVPSNLALANALLKYDAIKNVVPAGENPVNFVATGLGEAKDDITNGEGPGPEVPADFTLTVKPDDVFQGTTKSEVISAPAGTLQNTDIILDSSITDNDVLNAVVNSSNLETRITNVETINLVGEYMTTGFELKNVSSAKVVNLSTNIANGTATITGANSVNAAKIVAGKNVAALNITSLASGTRDAVVVDAGAAATVNITGVAAGADSYDVKLAKNVAVTLNTIDSAGDSVRLDLAGGDKNKLTQNTVISDAETANLKLTINAGAEATTIETAGSTAIAKEVTLTGSKDIILQSADGTSLSKVAITDSTTGKTAIQLTGSVAASTELQKAKVDVVELKKAATIAGGTLTLNENAKLNLAGNATNAVKLNVNNDEKEVIKQVLDGAGTLRVDLSESQTAKLTTEAKIGTLIIQATPDEQSDTDQDKNGHKESSIKAADVDLNAKTTALLVNGTENLVLTKLTAGADKTAVVATNLTGNLTLSEVIGVAGKDITVVGGKGNTTIGSFSTNAANVDIQLSAGTNRISLDKAAAESKVTATGGTNTITLGENKAIIKLGDGADSVTVGAAVGVENSEITLGAGADTLTLAQNGKNVILKDFEKGVDTIVLGSGVTIADTKTFNLSKIVEAAPTDGKYVIQDGSGNNAWAITLENNGTKVSATDFSDSVQLSGISAAAGATIVAGAKNDSINVAVAASKETKITTGAGKDTVTIAAGAQGTDGKTTITDFTTGSDKIVIIDAISDDLSINLTNVTSTAGVYTVGDTTKGASFVLQNGGKNIVTEDNLTSIVQLGSSTNNFVVKNTGTAAVSVTGGTSNDFIELTGNTEVDTTVAGVTTNSDGKQATFNFSNNGGVDTVTLNELDGKSLINFNNLTGISTAITGGSKEAKKFYLAADAAKVGDAVDGAAYVFASSSDGAGTAKITTFEEHATNGITKATILAEVAAFINAGLGVATGEKYVVVINDTSTTTYKATAAGGNDAGAARANDAYVYLVTGDADGVQADNVQLIGQLNDSTSGGTNDIVFTDTAWIAY